jgi:LacI family transcriptional regulator
MTRTLKYQVIKDWLVEQAANPAARKAMPSIRQIRKRFGVSLAPVNRALQELEQEGIIERRQGTATVASNRSRAINKSTDNQRSTGTVVAIFPDYPSEVYWRMCHVLEHQTRLLQLNLQMYKFDHTLDLADALAFAQSQKKLRGIVLVTGSNALDVSQLDQLALADIPVTLCDHLFQYDSVPGNVTILTPSAALTGTRAVAFLRDRGHRKIGYVRNEPKTDQGDHKLAAVLKAARDLDMPIDKRAVFSAAIKSWSSSMDAAIDMTHIAIPVIRELGLTALIYQSTPGAFAACQVFDEAGIKVGKDISLISGGDYEYAQYACPSLTVLSTDYVQMAKDAVTFLIDKPTDLPCLVEYPPQIIERKSVCRID